MKIIFNDATELQVQHVEEKGDYLSIKTISANPEQLRAMFEDSVKTRRIIVEEQGKKTIYEGYTTYYRSEEYPGKIYGVVNYKPQRTPEAQVEMIQASVMIAQMQAQTLTDEQAVSVKVIYPQWSGESVAYEKGYKVLCQDILYKCLQAHTSQSDWKPDAAVSLWSKVLV